MRDGDFGDDMVNLCLLKVTINLHTCISISMQASKASFSLMRTAMHLEHPRASTFLHLLDALVR